MANLNNSSANTAAPATPPPGEWKLPNELTLKIALYSQDREICNLAAVSKKTSEVTADNSHLWRIIFCQEFDLPTDKDLTSKEIKELYQKRRKFLRSGCFCFKDGNTKGETKALRSLLELIIEAYPSWFSEAHGHLVSLNVAKVNIFAYEHNLLANVNRHFRGNKNPQLIALQLVLPHLNLGLELGGIALNPTFGFHDSQKAVYETALSKLIFQNGWNNIDVEWVMHCTNFFKYHLTSPDAQTAFQAFAEIPDEFHIKALEGGLHNEGHALGNKWMGTFAYLDQNELGALRRARANDNLDIFQDKHIDESKFQMLNMEFPTGDMTSEWPSYFEDSLHSLAPLHEPRTRAQRRSPSPSKKAFYFEADGIDEDEPFRSKGWLNPLPSQYGIPGWQRMTMMKYFEEPDGSPAMDSLWAYEGVVIPGGKVIVGRWWSVSGLPINQNQYCGPFILWAIPRDDDFDLLGYVADQTDGLPMMDGAADEPDAYELDTDEDYVQTPRTIEIKTPTTPFF
ncbi:hypothetical protein NA57DRAFT_60599 [Rhizodiscina lignyota]|uniref:F-box domain-containing protein n=1 Tax=Rhizodiscina lignyota TaxID=1504668 RepID=A0A9P4M1F9_9PEZI|nr:hypothetical protein NA57DRAFT_60599 [Rhizodiscina lignyota]